jgi:hypothetical protein
MSLCKDCQNRYAYCCIPCAKRTSISCLGSILLSSVCEKYDISYTSMLEFYTIEFDVEILQNETKMELFVTKLLKTPSFTGKNMVFARNFVLDTLMR